MFSFFYFTQSNRKCAKLQSEKAVKTEPSCEVHLQALLSCIMHDYFWPTVLWPTVLCLLVFFSL